MFGGRFDSLGKNVVIATSLVAAGFFGAWLRFRPHLGSTGSYTDGVQQYEGTPDEPLRYAVWDSPTTLAGEVNTDEAEHSPTISADGQWIVFSSGERGANAELWIAELDGELTRDARPLYELNTTYDELAPAFGEGALWFATNRSGGAGGFDLWRADFADGEFGEPEPLGKSLNSSKDELDPAPLPGGDALAFASNRDTRGRTGCDFYIARPGAEKGWEVTALDALNSKLDDRELCFTGDGRRVVFASDRDGTRGDYDLYGSLNERGTWLPPTALAGLDSERVERAPSVAKDGFTLWLEMSRGDSAPDLYRARSLELFQRPGPRVGWLDLIVLLALLLLALLAFLAKKWETLEVLYKCFLVSVIAHLFLMWWFRNIHPESEVVPLEAGSSTFQVQLAAAPRSANSSSAERGGALMAERDEAAAELAAPQRQEAEAESFEAPAEAREQREVARSEATPSALPEREAAESTPSQAVATPAAQLADAREAAPLYSERGPALEVAASEVSAASEHEVAELGRPSRAAQAASSAPTPVAARHAVARESRHAQEAMPESTAREDGATSARPAHDPSLAAITHTEGPSEAFERSAGEALALDLPALAMSATRSSQAAAPSRVASSAHATSSDDALMPAPRPALSARPSRERAELPGPRRAALAMTPTSSRALPSADLRSLPTHEALRSQPSSESSNDSTSSKSSASSAGLAIATSSTTTARPRERGMASAPQRLSTSDRVDIAKPMARNIEADSRRDAELPLEATRFEHTPFAARFGPAKARALEEFGGTQETEAAVAAGLAYLAKTQREEGFWGDPNHKDDKYGYVLVGKSGLALLAFLGAGHTHQSSTEHSPVVQRTLDFLLAIQGDSNGHFGNTSAYSHGIATYALAETFAVSGDPQLREPLERAVRQILQNQNQRRGDARRFGGWSYYFAGSRTIDSWPRVSITAWQVMALRSAQLAGIDVPESALADAKTFLLGALDERRGCFRYSHDPSRLRGPYAILPGSTPAALFALNILGEDLDQVHFREPVRFVMQRAPSGYRYTGDDDFVERARGNLYFWYYGSLAMMKRGGNAWERWNSAMKETLVGAQRDDGSWQPISAYARYADDRDREAVYSTAMCVLSLEVYYRYFTPLLDAKAR